MTFNNKTIEDLHNLLVSKEISATELTQLVLNQRLPWLTVKLFSDLMWPKKEQTVTACLKMYLKKKTTISRCQLS